MVVLLLNAPLPLVDQVPDVAPPLRVAAIVAVPFEQMICAGPAFTTAAGFTFIVRVALTGAQPAGAFEVRVSVTVPVKFAAGV